MPTYGEQCVMTLGVHLMQQLFVDSWDSLLQVWIDSNIILQVFGLPLPSN